MVRHPLAIASAAIFALAGATSAAKAAPVEGSFASTAGSFFVGFELESPGFLTGSVLSSFSGSAGYDIGSVTLNGVPLADLLPGVGDDYFAFSVAVLPGLTTLSVKGQSFGGGFVGSYSVSPIPEPAALGLSLAALLAVGAAVAWRRRSGPEAAARARFRPA